MTRRPHWHAHSLGMARKHGNQVLFYFLYELDLKPKKSQGTQGAGELAWCGSISEYLLSFDNPPPQLQETQKTYLDHCSFMALSLWIHVWSRFSLFHSLVLM